MVGYKFQGTGILTHLIIIPGKNNNNNRATQAQVSGMA